MVITPKLELLRQMDGYLTGMRRALTQEHTRVLGGHGASVNDLRLLEYVFLQPDGALQNDIATHFGLDRATVSRVLNRLREAGHVEVEVDPSDRRARIVRITLAGAAYHRQLMAVVTEIVERQFASVTEAQLNAALDALRLIAQTIGVEIDLSPDQCGLAPEL